MSSPEPALPSRLEIEELLSAFRDVASVQPREEWRLRLTSEAHPMVGHGSQWRMLASRLLTTQDLSRWIRQLLPNREIPTQQEVSFCWEGWPLIVWIARNPATMEIRPQAADPVAALPAAEPEATPAALGFVLRDLLQVAEANEGRLLRLTPGEAPSIFIDEAWVPVGDHTLEREGVIALLSPFLSAEDRACVSKGGAVELLEGWGLTRLTGTQGYQLSARDATTPPPFKEALPPEAAEPSPALTLEGLLWLAIFHDATAVQVSPDRAPTLSKRGGLISMDRLAPPLDDLTELVLAPLGEDDRFLLRNQKEVCFTSSGSRWVIVPLPQSAGYMVTLDEQQRSVHPDILGDLVANRPGRALVYREGSFPELLLGNFPISIGTEPLDEDHIQSLARCCRPRFPVVDLPDGIRVQKLDNPPVAHWRQEAAKLVADSPFSRSTSAFEWDPWEPGAVVLAEAPGELVYQLETTVCYLGKSGVTVRLAPSFLSDPCPTAVIRKGAVFVLAVTSDKSDHWQLFRYKTAHPGRAEPMLRWARTERGPVWAVSPKGTAMAYLEPQGQLWSVQFVDLNSGDGVEIGFLPLSGEHPVLVVSDQDQLAVQMAESIVVMEGCSSQVETYSLSVPGPGRLHSISPNGLLCLAEGQFRLYPLKNPPEDSLPEPNLLTVLTECLCYDSLVVRPGAPVAGYRDQDWRALSIASPDRKAFRQLQRALRSSFSILSPVEQIEIGAQARFLDLLPDRVTLSKFRIVSSEADRRWTLTRASRGPQTLTFQG